MSQPETPAPTELQQMWAQLGEVNTRLDRLTEAVNGLGGNVQWIIENVQNIFQMFHSPQFMAMLPKMMAGGGMPNAGQGDSGTGNSGTNGA